MSFEWVFLSEYNVLNLSVSPEFSVSGPCSCPVGEETPFTLKSISGWVEKREMERRKKQGKLHYYNIIILHGNHLTTSKWAVLHSARRRQGNNRGRHNKAVIVCTKTFLISMPLPMSPLGFNMRQYQSLRPPRTFCSQISRVLAYCWRQSCFIECKSRNNCFVSTNKWIELHQAA